MVFFLSVLFAVMFSLIFGLVYPGEEGTAGYVETISNIFGALVQTVDNPGYYFWILFGNIFAFQMYIPLFAIFVGVNILPFRDKDGKELLFTTSKSNLIFLLENSILISILLSLTCFIAYLISIAFLALNTNLEGVPNITSLFIMIIFLGLNFAFLSAFGCSLTFSRKGGYLLGGFYFIFNFLIGNVPITDELAFLKDFSLTSRAEIFMNSVEAKIPFDFVFLSIILVFSFILGIFILLCRKNFIESYSQKSLVITDKRSGILNKLTFIQTPLNKLFSFIGWRFPIIRDQLQANTGLITVFLIAIAGFTIYVLNQWGAIEPSEFGALLYPLLQNPFFKGILYDHTQSINLSLDSWLAYQLFGFSWLYYGVFLLLIINDITNRDYKNDYVELTYALPKSRSIIILQRTIASVFVWQILFATNFLTLLGMEILLNDYSDFNNLITAFLTMDWAYTVTFIFFLAFLLLFPSQHGFKIVLIVFIASILMVPIAFILDIALLLFITPFGYFDMVGPIVGDLSLFDILPQAILFTCISIGFYVLVLKYRLPTRDLL